MAGGYKGGDILDGFVTPLVEAAEADEAAKKERAPATGVELLLFFLLLLGPVFIAFVLAWMLNDDGRLDFRRSQLEPAIAKETTTTTLVPAGPPEPTTTTTAIEVIQPPTEVIEGQPVPAPEPEAAPAPDTAAPHTAAPAPPHGG